jgi:hypothetical protein
MATCTVDLFSNRDGFGAATGWPGHWGRQGPELLAARTRILMEEQTLALGANTFRLLEQIVEEDDDPPFERLSEIPKVVISNTSSNPTGLEKFEGPRGDAIDVISEPSANRLYPSGRTAVCRSPSLTRRRPSRSTGYHGISCHYARLWHRAALPGGAGPRSGTRGLAAARWSHPATELHPLSIDQSATELSKE